MAMSHSQTLSFKSEMDKRTKNNLLTLWQLAKTEPYQT